METNVQELWLAFLSGAVFATVLVVILGGVVLGAFSWQEKKQDDIPTSYKK